MTGKKYLSRKIHCDLHDIDLLHLSHMNNQEKKNIQNEIIMFIVRNITEINETIVDIVNDDSIRFNSSGYVVSVKSIEYHCKKHDCDFKDEQEMFQHIIKNHC